ncbi:unnamed protein product [Thelazia callipaeda]|uniref:Protein krueppel n=1 Tax=Thelazia callipaeda TaxID=103827 RepID=A0A0N5CS68_THECL|nr:unnamed protein product [Thelazia callipaeda]
MVKALQEEEQNQNVTCQENASFSNHIQLIKRIQHGLQHYQQLVDAEKQFRCKKCAESFSHFNFLKRHKKIHANHKPYECSKCNKLFRYVSELKMHKKTHIDNNIHQCLQDERCQNEICHFKKCTKENIKLIKQRNFAGKRNNSLVEKKQTLNL